VSYAVLVWLNSLYSPVHLRSFSKNEKQKTACPAKKRISFCSSASVDFCLFALSAGRIGTGRHCSTEGAFWLSLD
jgi:hypothetical protein